jgi:hypothetical protein
LTGPRFDSLSLLVGGVAHDLNNTLAPILMSAERLAIAPGGRRPDLLENIRTGARHCAALARQLLAITRGVGVPRSELRLEALMDGFAGLIRPMLGRNLRLDLEFRREAPPVRADATQVRQALMNLCTNARDAMAGGGRIGLALDRIDFDDACALAGEDAGTGAYAVLSVSDTGAGIPAGIMDRIFDPFFTTKDAGTGMGLGLPTVKEIVKAHGGFLAVESEPGQGTTFRIFLPSAADAQLPAGQDRPAAFLCPFQKLRLDVQS